MESTEQNKRLVRRFYEEIDKGNFDVIDELVAEQKLSRVDFIKMDIEGAEKNALKGARATLNHFRPHMSISSEHLPDDVQKIPAVVREIEPAYRLEYADCQDQGSRVTPLVLQFF